MDGMDFERKVIRASKIIQSIKSKYKIKIDAGKNKIK